MMREPTEGLNVKPGLVQLYHDDSPITDITVVGERSTGTNYGAFLINKNFGFNGASYRGWKHGFLQAPAIGRGHLFVICSRNVIDWLKSIYAKPWHCPEHLYGQGFSHFIRSSWDTVCDRPKAFANLPDIKGAKGRPLLLDRNPIDGLPFANAIQLRSAKYRSFLGFAARQISSVVAPLEYFQKQPEAFVSDLASIYGLRPRSQVITKAPHQMGSKGPFGAPDQRREETEEISDTDLDYILSQLDLELEAELGYSYDS